jgi:hypothetical protein
VDVEITFIGLSYDSRIHRTYQITIKFYARFLLWSPDEIHTAEPLVPDPSPFDVEVSIVKIEKV